MTRHQFLQRAVLAQVERVHNTAHDTSLVLTAAFAVTVAIGFADALEAAGVTWDDGFEPNVVDGLEMVSDRLDTVVGMLERIWNDMPEGA